MSNTANKSDIQRRHFMTSTLAMTGMAAASSVAGSSIVWGATKRLKHKQLDPVNPDILFGTTSSIYGGGGNGLHHDLEWGVKRCAELGLQGIESYPDGIEMYRSDPMKLKALFDKYNMTFIGASNGEKGQSTNFIDLDKIPKLFDPGF